MGFFGNIFGTEKRVQPTVNQPETEQRNTQCKSTEEGQLIDSLVFGKMWSETVRSRELSTFYACIELISNAISSMQLRVMREDSDGHRTLEKHHPLQRIFKNKNL